VTVANWIGEATVLTDGDDAESRQQEARQDNRQREQRQRAP
jgi:hypothetical protein